MKRIILSTGFAFCSLFIQRAFGQQCTQPLPPAPNLNIYFCTFSAVASGCNANVSWTTVHEDPGQNVFQIWRSSDARNWVQIASVNGTNGTDHEQSYTYKDLGPYNPTGQLFYQVLYLNYGQEVIGTYISTINSISKSSCPGSLGTLCTGTATMNGYSSPLSIGSTETLGLSGLAPQTINWSTSNSSIASVNPASTTFNAYQPSTTLTANAPGTASITGKYMYCNVSVTKNLTVPGPAYSLYPNSCNGSVPTTTLINGKAGDAVVVSLSYQSYSQGGVTWNGFSNGTGAVITLRCANQFNSASSIHYSDYVTHQFSLNTQITFTMPAASATITTNAITNNSTTMLTSNATLTVVSVNGVAKNYNATVCGGNSSGSW